MDCRPAHPRLTGKIMNTLDLDAISLKQALLDFEVANARVVDLTARLTTLSKELLQSKTELATIKLKGGVPLDTTAFRAISIGDATELAELRSLVSQLRASRAIRIAKLFSAKLRKALV